MKAAVQLLAPSGAPSVCGAGACVETAEALNRESHPRRGPRPTAGEFLAAARAARGGRRRRTLLDAAIDAAQPVLMRHAVSGRAPRRSAILMPVEVDPLLFTQVARQPARQRGRGDVASGRAGRAARRAGRRSSAMTRSQSASPTRGPGSAEAHLPRALQALLHDQAGRARPRPGGQPEHPRSSTAAESWPRIVPPHEGRGRRLRGSASGGPMSVQVLVADDEPLIRQSLRATLAREGFDVTRGGVGQRGVAALPGGSRPTSSCWTSCSATPTASTSCAGCGRRRRTRRSS